MNRISRRRFISISAAAALAGRPVSAASLREFRGSALGARATITLAHPDADRIASDVFGEIARLERVFSLFLPDSAISRLNAERVLRAPPPELLECLSTCSTVHAATGGLFDPTVQPLWALYARSHAGGKVPSEAEIDRTLQQVGWSGVTYDSREIRFEQDGMALTLNGVAQGYIADCVADMLAGEGLDDILVNTGEYRALGGRPEGGGWPVVLDVGGERVGKENTLRDMSLASSSPTGTVFDARGEVGHILDPRTGLSAQSRWKLVSVLAPRAALADALSTAMCLMGPAEIRSALSGFQDVRLLHLG